MDVLVFNAIKALEALQSGLATEIKQDAQTALITTIDADTSNISTKIDTIAGAVVGTEMQVDVLTMPNVTVISTNLDIRDLTFAADKVDASGTVLGAGTNNIGDVDIVSSVLPTGAATVTNQNTQITALLNLLTELQLKADLTETQPILSESFISAVNSSDTNLSAGNSYTFTGVAELTGHPDLMLNLFANQPCTIQMQFSTNGGTNWDSTITYTSLAGINEFHTLVKGKRHFRIVVTTASLTTTVFRLQLQYGQFIQGRSALNTTLNLDNDSLVVRPSNRELEVARGLIAGHISINKFGNNADIDIGTEDIWGTGGTWVQPTVATTVTFVSTSVADSAAGTGARTLLVEGLDGSYNQVSETLTLNGTTPVNTVLSYFIIHRIIVLTAGTGGTNAGLITTTWTGGGTPVGPSVQMSKAQTQFAIYQIPAGYTGYLEQYGGGVQGGTTLDLELFVKPFGGVFNLKGKIALNSGGTSNNDYDYKYPIKVLEKGIIKLVGTVATNNTDVSGYFDLIIITN